MPDAIFPWISSAHIQLGSGFNTLKFEPCGLGVEESRRSLIFSSRGEGDGDFGEMPDRSLEQRIQAYFPNGQSEDNELGQKVRYAIEMVEDERFFRETLNIAASASFAGATGGGSARFSLFKSVTINSYDVFLIASVSVIDHVKGLDRPAFTNLAKLEWSNTRLNSRQRLFTRIFGDRFVNSITYGGEMFVIFRYSCESREERQEVQASLEGATGSFSAAADFNQKIEEVTTTRSHKLKLFRDGGEGRVASPNVADLLEATLNFPQEVRDHPVPISFETRPYHNIPAAGLDVDVENLDAQFLVEDLSEVYLEATQLLGSWGFVLRYLNFFSGVDEQMVRTQISQLEDVRKSVRRSAERVGADPFSDLSKVIIPDLSQMTRAPEIAKGVSLPVRLNTNWKQGGNQVSEDGFTKGYDLQGFSIECDQLPNNVQIKYWAHIGHVGDRGPWDSPAMSKEGRVEGLRISLDGPDKDRFAVRYWLYRANSSFVYFGENGSFAGTKGQYMRCDGLKVQIVTV